MLQGSRTDVGPDVDDHGRLADLLLKASPTVYSASLAQQRLWFLHQLQHRSTAYNVHLGLWLKGSLELGALQASLLEMVNRHDSLHTAFRFERGKLQQIVSHAYSVEIPITDLTRVAEPIAEAYRRARLEVEEPFDLTKAPLFRVRLFRVTPLDHVFLCTMHHIVTDAWSLQIFAKELSLLYGALLQNQASPLPRLPIRYGDFAEWQLEWFDTDRVQHQVAYWKGKLERAPALLELPTDTPRPREQTFEGAIQVASISSETIQGIEKIATGCRATAFMVQLAAFKVLLYRYAKQPDIVVGIPIAGRDHVETEGLIGFFVNTLVSRDDLSGNPRFTDLVVLVRETILDGFSNADIPFEKIVEALQPERNLGYNPIFQVMFATLKSAVRSNEFGNLTAFPYVVSAETSIFDLSMTLIEDIDRNWWAQLEYNTNLFNSERISRTLSDYTSILEGVVSDPEGRILALPLPSRPESVDQSSRTTEGQERNDYETKPSFTGSPRNAREVRSKPLDQEQELLVEVWKEVLGLREVGIQDSFFDIGGHSLIAVRLIERVYEITGRLIPVAAIFRAPTIEAFAPLLRENVTPVPDQILVQLKDGDGIVPFFAIVAPGADTFGLSLLALHIGKDQSVYKVQASSPIAWGRPYTNNELRVFAQEYVAAMRSVQPHGPYCLGGMCEGVRIAQEVILELESQNEVVGFLAIFDTWVLENSQVRALWAVDYYRQRLQIFRSLSRHQRLATTRRFVKRLLAKISLHGSASGSGWNRAYWPGEGFSEPRFRAPVCLFKRARQPFYFVRDRQMGWGVRSAGGVEIFELNCAHHEFLRHPQVGIVGQALTNKLQSVRDGCIQRTIAPSVA
jgi:thioesterase domain-containing protein